MSKQERTLLCPGSGCMRKFKTEEAMLQHQVDRHGTKLPLPTVSQPFGPRLQRSQSQDSSTAPPSKKSPLDGTLQRSQSQKPSTAQLPTSKKVLACMCGQKFKEYPDLFQHQRATPSHQKVAAQHSGSITSCSECKAIFQDAYNLAQHFLAKHPVTECERGKYNEIAIQFEQKWTHPGRRPTIVNVFHVHNPAERLNRFEEYRQRLKLRNNGQENEVSQFYHGTTVRCGLGASTRSICSNTSCNLCSIIKCGFKKKKAEVSGFLRFGAGIYVTQTSSKANDYVKAHDDAAQGLRAMFVCRVLTGRSFETRFNMTDLLQPPPEYDSVRGVVGGSLNYDELVVYQNSAILPEFVIVYKI